jgi:hypothetical protein
MVPSTRVVQREVCEMVPRQIEQEVTYCVMEQFTTPQTRTVNYCEQIMVDQPFTYTVCVPVMVPEQRQVQRCNIVTKQVPYTYTVCVPRMEQQMRTVNRVVCEPQTVTEMRCVCRRVPETVCDPCTGCTRTVCRTVTEMVPCTKTIMVRRCVQEQCPVQVCRMIPEQRQGHANRLRARSVHRDHHGAMLQDDDRNPPGHPQGLPDGSEDPSRDLQRRQLQAGHQDRQGLQDGVRAGQEDDQCDRVLHGSATVHLHRKGVRACASGSGCSGRSGRRSDGLWRGRLR